MSSELYDLFENFYRNSIGQIEETLKAFGVTEDDVKQGYCYMKRNWNSYGTYSIYYFHDTPMFTARYFFSGTTLKFEIKPGLSIQEAK